MFKVIIWASDASEHADRALDYAKGLAEASSAHLIAVHVNEITVGRAGVTRFKSTRRKSSRKFNGR